MLVREILKANTRQTYHIIHKDSLNAGLEILKADQFNLAKSLPHSMN